MNAAAPGNGRLSTIAAALLLAMLLPVTAAQGKELRAVAVIPPLQYLLDRIGGPTLTTASLVDGGRDPHSFEPTMRQIADLAKADLYVSGDLEFERGLRDKLHNANPNLAIVTPPAAIPRLTAEADDHDRHDRLHQDLDPHLWLSPLNAREFAAAIAQSLITRDPDAAAGYRDNLARLSTELDEVHTRIAAQLAPYRGRTFYVYHPALAYFAREYGLIQKAVEVGGRTPSPKQLARLIDQARRDRVRIVFVQPQFDRVSAATLATALGAAVIPLDVTAYDLVATFRRIAERLRESFEAAP